MSTDEHSIPNYMAIFWWLLGLTIAEIAWAVIPHHSELVLAGGIVSLAIVQAVLVARSFMHPKFERKDDGASLRVDADPGDDPGLRRHRRAGVAEAVKIRRR